MRRRFLSLLLSCVMVLGLVPALPTQALAVDRLEVKPTEITVAGTTLTGDESSVELISREKAYTLDDLKALAEKNGLPTTYKYSTNNSVNSPRIYTVEGIPVGTVLAESGLTDLNTLISLKSKAPDTFGFSFGPGGRFEALSTPRYYFPNTLTGSDEGAVEVTATVAWAGSYINAEGSMDDPTVYPLDDIPRALWGQKDRLESNNTYFPKNMGRIIAGPVSTTKALTYTKHTGTTQDFTRAEFIAQDQATTSYTYPTSADPWTRTEWAQGVPIKTFLADVPDDYIVNFAALDGYGVSADGLTKAQLVAGNYMLAYEKGASEDSMQGIREQVKSDASKVGFLTLYGDGAQPAKMIGEIKVSAPQEVTHAVTFEANGGTPEPESQNVEDGGLVSEPPAMTRANYTFAGWFSDPGLTDAWNFGSDTIDAATTLYAKWTGVPRTVSFASAGGSPSPLAQTVPYGEKAAEPPAMTRANYKFEGWFTTPSFATKWDFGNDTVTANITLFAKWVEAEAEELVVLEVYDSGTLLKGFTLSELEEMAAAEARGPQNFSSYNTFGTFKPYPNQEGPTLEGIIQAAAGSGLADALTDGKNITFNAFDGFISTFSKTQITQERFYYPSASGITEGSAPTSAQLAGAERVDPMIGWASNGRAYVGQLGPSEQIASVYSQSMIRTSADHNPGKIILNSADTAKIVTDIVIKDNQGKFTPGQTFDLASAANPGAELFLRGTQIYYTLDGSMPSVNSSALYNYNSFNGINKAITAPTEPGNYALKILLYGYGAEDKYISLPFTVTAPDTTAPTVAAVTPTGTEAKVSGSVTITFSEPMDPATAGTVQLNSLAALTGGTWSLNNTIFTIPYSGLANSTAYTVNIAGFADVAGNVMEPSTTNTFTTEAPLVVLEVYDEAGSTPKDPIKQFTLAELEALASEENLGARNFSSYNRFGSFGDYLNEEGPTVDGIIEEATGSGLSESITDGQNIKFIAYDGFIGDFSKTQITQDRFYYPSAAGIVEGSAPTPAQLAGAVRVDPMIGWSEDGRLFVGQIGPSESTSLVFVKNMARPSTSYPPGKIILNSGATATIPEEIVIKDNKVQFTPGEEFDLARAATPGTKLSLNSAKVYYTLDGSTPSVYSSAIYNYNSFSSPSINKEITAPTEPGIYTLKLLLYRYGAEDKLISIPFSVPDPTVPTVAVVTPTGTDAKVSGSVTITFSEPMDPATAGTVQLNSLAALTGGTWSLNNTIYTIPYSGLANSTAYTVNISGFRDATGNVMEPSSTNTFTTEALVVLEVYDADSLLKQFTLAELEAIAAEENLGARDFSAYNRYGTFGDYLNEEGPTIEGIVKASTGSGLAENIDDGQNITFSSNDGFRSSFSKTQITQDRFYYPAADSIVEGSAPTPAQLAGAVRVAPMIGWSEDGRLFIGQLGPSEQTASIFAKYMLRTPTASSPGKIILNSGPTATIPDEIVIKDNKAQFTPGEEFDLASAATPGTKLSLNSAKLYYTLDGSIPSVHSSPLYNYNSFVSPSINKAITAPTTPGNYTLKILLYLYGSVDKSISIPFKVAAPVTSVDRLAGLGRIDTANAIAKDTFPKGADAVVLASALDFPDALAATSLATAYDAPILLTSVEALEPATLAQIRSLDPDNIYIVGGTGVVSDAIKTKLAKDYTVERIAGVNRYATSKAIADRVFAITGSDRIFVVSGEDFPDALSVSAIAAREGMPIMLNGVKTLDPGITTFINKNKTKEAFIAGGTGVIAPAVANQLKAKGVDVDRWAGTQRYATSEAVINGAIKEWGLDVPALGIASGANFPDGLTGGAAMGKLDGVLAITEPNTLAPYIRTLIKDHKTSIVSAKIFGGTGVISDAVKNAFQTALK